MIYSRSFKTFVLEVSYDESEKPLVCFAACFLLFFAITAKQLTAQSTTASVTGSVVDSSGGVVAGAGVTLTSDATKEVHNTTANATGTFSFAAVLPGSYSLKVEHAGFKAAEQKGINVSATDHVALGDIQLQIGAVTDTIVVEEHATQVATDSSQVSAGINKDQLLNLTARGREVVSLLRIIPGVTYQADPDSAGATFGQSTPGILGSSANVNHIAIEGVTSNDQGSPSVFSSVTSLDAIGEVKVLLNSYQAEYAGNGGPVVQVVTKSGGQQYHGSAYDFVRNEALNANTFFNNRSAGVGAPRSRYRTAPPARPSAARSTFPATGTHRRTRCSASITSTYRKSPPLAT
jgi:Carboxypeptidase regulatory-like domain